MPPGSFKLERKHLVRLPLLPLPKLVFFPDTVLPLHVFEERYKEMVSWCIDEGWPIGVATIESGHEEEQLNNPPVAAIVGVGNIVHYQPLKEGRFNIVLAGLAKAEIVEEVDLGTQYRIAHTTVIPDLVPAVDTKLLDRTATLRSCVSALRQQWAHAPERLMDWICGAREPGSLTNRVASALFAEPSEQLDLLRCADVGQRVEACIQQLGILLAKDADQGLLH